MLFTMYTIKKKNKFTHHDRTKQKNTHKVMVETVGQRNKRLDILKQPNVSLKISIRNMYHLKTKAQCHLTLITSVSELIIIWRLWNGLLEVYMHFFNRKVNDPWP